MHAEKQTVLSALTLLCDVNCDPELLYDVAQFTGLFVIFRRISAAIESWRVQQFSRGNRETPRKGSEHFDLVHWKIHYSHRQVTKFTAAFTIRDTLKTSVLRKLSNRVSGQTNSRPSVEQFLRFFRSDSAFEWLSSLHILNQNRVTRVRLFPCRGADRIDLFW